MGLRALALAPPRLCPLFPPFLFPSFLQLYVADLLLFGGGVGRGEGGEERGGGAGERREGGGV